MFEITYDDSHVLQNFIDANKVYHGAIYDFTFEERFIVYHFFVKDTARYIALDSITGYGSEITRRRKEKLFDSRSYHSMTPMILNSIKYTDDKRYLNVIINRPLDVIKTIFLTILPEYGFVVREEQIKLSQNMYLGLTGKQVAICEAEVGAGKTLAYLIASFVAKERYTAEYGFSLPVTISTSSIELQKMIVEKEVPQLSRMLQDYGLIKHPLSAVVRKGKEHYFCKARCYDYLNKLMEHKEKYQKLLDYFMVNKIAVRAFDLDTWDMPAAIKGKICVKGRCSHCKYRDDCRYSCYVKAANGKGTVDFQVTNHNLFLTSIKTSDSESTSGIIQRSPYVVIDEAHKLLEAAQTTFGEQFSEGMIQKYINSVRYLKSEKVKENAYNGYLDRAKKTNQQLFAMLRKLIPNSEFNDERTFSIALPDAGAALILRLKETTALIEAARKEHRGAYEMDGKRIIKVLEQFVRRNNSNVWLELEEGNSLSLCCCPRNMADVMEKTVWNRSVSYVLTSGTMSDGRDFSFFKRENGIARLPKHLVSVCGCRVRISDTDLLVKVTLILNRIIENADLMAPKPKMRFKESLAVQRLQNEIDNEFTEEQPSEKFIVSRICEIASQLYKETNAREQIAARIAQKRVMLMNPQTEFNSAYFTDLVESVILEAPARVSLLTKTAVQISEGEPDHGSQENTEEDSNTD